MIALGLIDDTLGERRRRARRAAGAGTARRLLRGELSTGALKAVGSLGLALFAMSYLGLSNARWLLATAVLVLATNAFNLLDLRPGRATKAFVLLGARPRRSAPAKRARCGRSACSPRRRCVAGVYDLRERAMLGDTGANLLGALAGPVARARRCPAPGSSSRSRCSPRSRSTASFARSPRLSNGLRGCAN